MAHESTLQSMQHLVWQARIPLEIRLAPSECRVYDQADPYLVRPNVAFADSNPTTTLPDRTSICDSGVLFETDKG